MAALSHELRIPLTPVLGTLSNWESSASLPEPFAADVRMLSRNVRLEVRLIDDLLDLTRISRGQIELHKERVDVQLLISTAVDGFRGDTDGRQVRIGQRAIASRRFVDGDPVRLQQVFWNILSNALKHTPFGGRIEIVTANDGDDLRITFADNGRGMSAETLEHLFHPFERASDGPGYHRGGLGIGLTISQNIVQAHGGEIEARSEGPDLGSTFVVRLPALAGGAASSHARSGAIPIGEAANPLSILLVEDHQDSAMVIGRIVRNMGHSVVVSHNMTDALLELREQKFDLVLSDIGLPDGTGIELLEKTRAFSNVPMIALTGYGTDDDLIKYRKTGFLHQLTKPIRFEQLEKLLRDFAVHHGQPAG
jgi:CheY-like chemotaxis protein